MIAKVFYIAEKTSLHNYFLVGAFYNEKLKDDFLLLDPIQKIKEKNDKFHLKHLQVM